MLTRTILPALLAFTLLFACQNTPTTPPLSKQEKLAKAFCECTTELDALNQKAKVLQNKSMPQDSINAFFQRLQTEYTNSKDCLAAAIAQYGKLKPEDYPEVERHLQHYCPNMAKDKDFVLEMLGE